MSKKKSSKHSGNPQISEIQRKIDERFQIVKAFTRMADREDDILPYYPGPEVRKRRAKAIIHYLPIMVDKYQIAGMSDYFLDFCTCPDGLSDSIGSRDTVANWSLAAAIWILDELRFSGTLQKLNLEDYRDVTDFTVHMPDIVDSVHPAELVRSMVTLIQTQMIDTKDYRLLFHSINAEYGTKSAGSTTKSHEDFLSVIDLLDTERVQYVVDRFKKLNEEIFTAYFNCAKFLAKEKACRTSSIIENQALAMLIQDITLDKEHYPEHSPEAVVEELVRFSENFKVEDPYEACFVIFYLLAMGDDLVWLYTPILPILNKCWDLLPWNLIDDNPGKPDVKLTELKPDQWTYVLTKTLLPRDAASHRYYANRLQKTGLSEQTIEIYSSLLDLATAHYGCVRTQSALHRQELQELAHKKAESHIIETPISAPTEDAVRLENENAHLRKELQNARHTISKQERRIAALEKQNQSEHDELIALREYLYYQDDSEDNAETEKIPVQLPYRTDRRIVCLGGDEPWLKKISKLLPDVNFCKPDVKTNIAAFEYADEIWIQPIGLLHKESFPVTNLAKMRNIPIRCFKQVNAQKCAEQLARYDMKMR